MSGSSGGFAIPGASSWPPCCAGSWSSDLRSERTVMTASSRAFPSRGGGNVHVYASFQEAASFARGSLRLETTVQSSWLGIGQSAWVRGLYPRRPGHPSKQVFTARSEAVTYWRGESKAYYDGRGWSNGDANQAVIEVPNPTAEGAGSDRGIDAGRSVFSQDTIITQEIKNGRNRFLVPGEYAVLRRGDPLRWKCCRYSAATAATASTTAVGSRRRSRGQRRDETLPS